MALPFALGLVAAVANAAACALVFGAFCVRSTRIYFSMLTLAFAQIVWAICFKWNSVTGGEQGLSNVPYPDLDWMAVDPGARRSAHRRPVLSAGPRADGDRVLLLSSASSPRRSGAS